MQTFLNQSFSVSQLPRLAQLAGSCAALVLTLAACESPSTTKTAPATNAAPASAAVAAPTAAPFGKTLDGTAVQLFTLTNAKGAKATITNYGGILTSLLVPDKNGRGVSYWASTVWKATPTTFTRRKTPISGR